MIIGLLSDTDIRMNVKTNLSQEHGRLPIYLNSVPDDTSGANALGCVDEIYFECESRRKTAQS